MNMPAARRKQEYIRLLSVSDTSSLAEIEAACFVNHKAMFTSIFKTSNQLLLTSLK